MKPSLRSANEGYQYYNVTLEGDLDKTGTEKSSTSISCTPLRVLFFELSEHAEPPR